MQRGLWTWVSVGTSEHEINVVLDVPAGPKPSQLRTVHFRTSDGDITSPVTLKFPVRSLYIQKIKLSTPPTYLIADVDGVNILICRVEEKEFSIAPLWNHKIHRNSLMLSEKIFTPDYIIAAAEGTLENIVKVAITQIEGLLQTL